MYKKRKLSKSTFAGLLDDKQHTSDQILALPGAEVTESAVYRNAEKSRLLSLKASESKFDGSDYLQLHYDGRIMNGLDRYVLLRSFGVKTLRNKSKE